MLFVPLTKIVRAIRHQSYQLLTAFVAILPHHKDPKFHKTSINHLHARLLLLSFPLTKILRAVTHESYLYSRRLLLSFSLTKIVSVVKRQSFFSPRLLLLSFPSHNDPVSPVRRQSFPLHASCCCPSPSQCSQVYTAQTPILPLPSRLPLLLLAGLSAEIVPRTA